jgi:hypothetical protein
MDVYTLEWQRMDESKGKVICTSVSKEVEMTSKWGHSEPAPTSAPSTGCLL